MKAIAAENLCAIFWHFLQNKSFLKGMLSIRVDSDDPDGDQVFIKHVASQSLQKNFDNDSISPVRVHHRPVRRRLHLGRRVLLHRVLLRQGRAGRFGLVFRSYCLEITLYTQNAGCERLVQRSFSRSPAMR